MGCSCGCSCTGRCASFAPGGSLGPMGEALICIEDAGRNIETLMGMRPYSVHIVRTVSAGAARGQGVETVLEDREVLPVPLLGDLSGLTRMVTAAQVEEVGTLLLTEVSGAYSERQITGQPEDRPIAGNETVYYELRFRDGQRRRFAAASAPFYDAGKAMWRVVLAPQRGGRDRLTGNP